MITVCVANLAVDAVMRLQGSNNLEHIQMIKKQGGSLRDSYLEEGFILEKSIGVGQPKRIENAKILVANTAMDTDKIKIYGSRVRVSDLDKVAEVEQVEKDKMKAKVDKILAHDINVFINRQLIYNWPEQVANISNINYLLHIYLTMCLLNDICLYAKQLFAEAGVMAIEHADFEGVERLAAVTGGEIVSTFDHPDKVKLGHAKLIEEIMIGEDKVIRFSGVGSGEACTIVLRGASKHVLEEADRSLHDALCVLTQAVQHPRITHGGGCAEVLLSIIFDLIYTCHANSRKANCFYVFVEAFVIIYNFQTLMANAIDQQVAGVAGKAALAMEGFARALRQMPATIADNGGLDSAQLVTELRAAHHSVSKTNNRIYKQKKIVFTC